MKIFLAGEIYYDRMGDIIKRERPYVLTSFYYANKTTEEYMRYYSDFLLDSGAFTFMQNTGSHVDWDAYLQRYAEFINRYDVKKFFELDIDSIVGYQKVLEYRKRLEDMTGKQPIPVWHTNRGSEEFIRMCEEYPYVAIGGLVGFGNAEYAKKYWAMFPWFIHTAHSHGAMIHALGFTSLIGIKRYHFDSVDSTTWVAGGKFGKMYLFTGDDMIVKRPPKGKRVQNAFEAAKHNYMEWVKFQRYADQYL